MSLEIDFVLGISFQTNTDSTCNLEYVPSDGFSESC